MAHIKFWLPLSEIFYPCMLLLMLWWHTLFTQLPFVCFTCMVTLASLFLYVTRKGLPHISVRGIFTGMCTDLSCASYFYSILLLVGGSQWFK